MCEHKWYEDEYGDEYCSECGMSALQADEEEQREAQEDRLHEYFLKRCMEEDFGI